MVTTRFDIDNKNQWCPGCGNFSILEAMKKAFISLDFKPEDLLIISGIGQAGKTPYFMECNMFNGLHGRALAIATALVSGAGFIARGFSDDIDQLSTLIEKAVEYKGFSMIDICQPCVSFNKFNTRSWYKKRIFRHDENTDEKGLKHDPHDYYKALKLAHIGEDKIPTGIIYLKPGIPFHERIKVLKEKPLCEYDFAEVEINRIINSL